MVFYEQAVCESGQKTRNVLFDDGENVSIVQRTEAKKVCLYCSENRGKRDQTRILSYMTTNVLYYLRETMIYCFPIK